MSAASACLTNFFRAIYPDRCALCQRVGEASPCPNCIGEMVRCADGQRFHPTEPFLQSIILYEYEGRAGQAVRALKFKRNTSLVGWMANELLQAYIAFGLDPEIIIPVPIHWRRKAMRGFNQAELICERLPSELIRPNALRRTRPTRSQVGLSIEERLTNLEGAFEASPEVAGRRILLVDDVTTSGQTARESAIALNEAGATEVTLLAFAGHHASVYDPLLDRDDA